MSPKCLLNRPPRLLAHHEARGARHSPLYLRVSRDDIVGSSYRATRHVLSDMIVFKLSLLLHAVLFLRDPAGILILSHFLHRQKNVLYQICHIIPFNLSHIN